MYLPIMIPAPLPHPIIKTQVSCEIVPVMLKAAIAAVPACAKMAVSVVIPKPQRASLKITGNAIFENFAKKEVSKLKMFFRRVQTSYFFA